MARITANSAASIAEIDLNSLIVGATAVTFFDNINLPSPYGGFSYPDILRIDYVDVVASRASWGGSFAWDAINQVVTSGTVTGYLESHFNGSTYQQALAVEGFSYSAVAIYNATISVSTVDDMLILQSILSGADTFNLSGQGDRANGFGGNDTLRGNGGNDTLAGGAGADWIDGGTGADRMFGGVGNDVYVIDNVGDFVSEGVGAGIDTVRSSRGYTLGNELENLVLTGALAINGGGNALPNTITGNGAANAIGGGAGRDTLLGAAGNDTLNGGSGNDVLRGGAGLDTFRFNAAPGSTHADRVGDFSSVDDRIELDNALMPALGAAGALPAAMFHLGAAATDATDRIVYNQATGALLYDADGNGAGAAMLIATLNAGTALALGDLFVI